MAKKMIYLEDAIEALAKILSGREGGNTTWWKPVAESELMLLPSAQPERIKGHWVEIASSNHTYKCSVCGRLLVNITDGKNNVAKNYPYCHCGADMRGEQDEYQRRTVQQGMQNTG